MKITCLRLHNYACACQSDVIWTSLLFTCFSNIRKICEKWAGNLRFCLFTTFPINEMFFWMSLLNLSQNIKARNKNITYRIYFLTSFAQNKLFSCYVKWVSQLIISFTLLVFVCLTWTNFLVVYSGKLIYCKMPIRLYCLPGISCLS